MKILFVEDTDVFIERFKPMLEKLGEVDHFKSSNAARRAMGREEDFKYDLIVCDHYILRFEQEMKPATGDEVYYHLRHWCSDTVPFIHFSSAPCPEKYDVRIYSGEKDKNFYVLGKNYNSPLMELIEDITANKVDETILADKE